jgi:hypothetical protein
MRRVVRVFKKKVVILKGQTIIVQPFNNASVHCKRNAAYFVQIVRPTIRAFSSTDHKREIELPDFACYFLDPLSGHGTKFFGGYSPVGECTMELLKQMPRTGPFI